MYIIKKHYVATEKNENFPNETMDYYSGKKGYSITTPLSKWQIQNYGYTTLSGAKQGLKSAIESAKWESNFGWWTVTAELIEV